MRAYFNSFTIEMTLRDAHDCSHQGRCDDDVKYLSEKKAIVRQLRKISDEDLKTELREYGAWSDKELNDRMENEQRILWIAAGNISEEHKERGWKE